MILSVLPLSRDATGAYHPPLHWVATTLRLAIFGAGTALALGAYAVLGSALSLLGGLCSITCSLVLPTAFYLLLSWRYLRWPARIGLGAMLALGLALVALVTAMNVCELVQSCRSHHMRGNAAAGSGWGALLLLGQS